MFKALRKSVVLFSCFFVLLQSVASAQNETERPVRLAILPVHYYFSPSDLPAPGKLFMRDGVGSNFVEKYERDYRGALEKHLSEDANIEVIPLRTVLRAMDKTLDKAVVLTTSESANYSRSNFEDFAKVAGADAVVAVSFCGAYYSRKKTISWGPLDESLQSVCIVKGNVWSRNRGVKELFVSRKSGYLGIVEANLPYMIRDVSHKIQYECNYVESGNKDSAAMPLGLNTDTSTTNSAKPNSTLNSIWER